jgi:hypothetical protein
MIVVGISGQELFSKYHCSTVEWTKNLAYTSLKKTKERKKRKA